MGIPVNGHRATDRAPFRWSLLCLATICLLALLASLASAERYWDDVDVQVVGSWTGPGGGGTDLVFDVSPDGSRLVTAGHVAENEVIVTDRDMDKLSTLLTADQDLEVRGVRWSETGRWVCAWGAPDGPGSDLLWLWDGTSYEPDGGLFPNHTTPLHRLDAVMFTAGDDILVLAGRDANGTSRVLLWETAWSTVRRDIPWKDNATVLQLGTDMMDIICVDDAGQVTSIGGSDWDDVEELGGHDAEPTATSLSVYARQPWVVGYDDGTALFWGGHPIGLENPSRFGEGPVTAVQWCDAEGGGYYLLATPEGGGGTRVSALLYDADGPPDTPVAEALVLPGTVTRMVYDVKVPGQVWCCLADGSIRLLNVTTIPDLQPLVSIEVPGFQKRYAKDFLARGTYWDDHQRIEYIRVRIDEGVWYDAEFSDGEWSYMINISQYGQGERIFNVVAYDGRTQTYNQTFFQLPLDDEGDREGEWPTGVPAIPFTIIAIAILVYLVWRWRTGGGDTS